MLANPPFHNLKECHEVPLCATPDLLMTVRQGIEIDYCPQAASPMQQMPPPQVQQPYYDQRHGHGDNHGYDNNHGYDSHGYPRKKSVWQELFD